MLVLSRLTFFTLLLLSATPLFAAQEIKTDAGRKIIKLTPGISTQKLLQGRADSDLVEFSMGKRLPVRDLRRLDSISQKLRGTGKPMPPSFSFRPAPTGSPVRQRGDLAAALKRPDSDTIVLPSGELLTVGQLRLLKPRIEKILGHPLDAVPGRQTPIGPATRLQKSIGKSEWQGLLKQPDNTILESPGGKRITVGELKQVLTMGRSRMPAKMTGAHQ
jgi:hypothetical protein